jgi:DNA-binding transcriptional LysR family regulator
MDIHQLRTFLEVGRRGSMTAAARVLHRTQPAVSAQIRALEKDLGQRLFIRRRRGVELTEVGRRFLLRVEDWLREMESTVDEVRLWGRVEHGHLRLGTTDVPAIHWLPRILKNFLRKHPGLRVSVHVDSSRELVEATLRGDVELALVTLPVGEEDLEVRPLHREPLVVVCPPRHPLAGRRVEIAALTQETLILHKPDSVTRRTVEGLFRSRGLLPRVGMETSHPEAMKRLVRIGLGLSVLPESMVREELRRGLLGRILVRGWRLVRQTGIVWPVWRPLSEAARAWVEHLTAARRGQRRS